jgi:hypothetical protein
MVRGNDRDRKMERIVSAENVRARWAYSELLSDRPYDDPSLQELKKKALERVPFEDLSAEERGLLAQAWYPVRGVPTFIHGFAGITTFQLADWSKEQLATSYAIPYFAHEIGAYETPVTFKQWIEAEPIRPVEPGHARYAASGSAPSTQGEPLIVGRLSRLPTLLDGYHRAVRFWKRGEPNATLAVYVPRDALGGA